MTNLSEIDEHIEDLRADGAKAGMWRTTEVAALLEALHNIELLCTTSEEHAAEYGDTASDYVDDIRMAMKGLSWES